MANKKERNRQERRDKEREYMESFLARLSKASTVAAATNVATQATPHVNGIGRRRHANLIHVLGGIEASGAKPPYRVLRDYPLTPGMATIDERVAYSRLFERFAQSGEITTDDAAYGIRILSSPSRTFVDLI